MTDRFLKFLPFVFEHEDAISHGNVVVEHISGDAGGTTKYGIDARSHPGVDIENLTKEKATAIYWNEWAREGCEALIFPLGEVFSDCCIRSGWSRARDILLDFKTPALFLDEYDRFLKVIASRGQNQKFLNGWLQRNDDLRKRFGIAKAV